MRRAGTHGNHPARFFRAVRQVLRCDEMTRRLAFFREQVDKAGLGAGAGVGAGAAAAEEQLAAAAAAAATRGGGRPGAVPLYVLESELQALEQVGAVMRVLSGRPFNAPFQSTPVHSSPAALCTSISVGERGESSSYPFLD